MEIRLKDLGAILREVPMGIGECKTYRHRLRSTLLTAAPADGPRPKICTCQLSGITQAG
jgi:hypothetical protein